MFCNIYIDNYKCLQDFNLNFCDHHSLLLAGMNGSGKTAILEVLILLQSIGRGEAKIANLIKLDSITAWSSKNELTFKYNVKIDEHIYEYLLLLEKPIDFFQFRVAQESLSCDGKSIYERHLATVTIKGKNPFDIDWHSIALPLISTRDLNSPINKFESWLAEMFLLRPIPHLMEEEINHINNNFLSVNCKNFTNFFMEQMTHDYSLFLDIKKYVKNYMPDFAALKTIPFDRFGQRRLNVSFDGIKDDIAFSQLSDGEKIFILQGVILGLASRIKNMFVFWDEPDNYLARAEIQNFVRNLRSAFSKNGQIILTSHNEQAALAFSAESSILVQRKNHSSPSSVIPIPDDVDFPDVLSETMENWINES